MGAMRKKRMKVEMTTRKRMMMMMTMVENASTFFKKCVNLSVGHTHGLGVQKWHCNKKAHGISWM
jgi:hypothetical protein